MRRYILISVMISLAGLPMDMSADEGKKGTTQSSATRLTPGKIHRLVLAKKVPSAELTHFDQRQVDSSSWRLKAISHPIKDTTLLKSLSESLLTALHTPLEVDDLPFSGILSYQVFLSKQGRVLAIAHIVCSPDGYVVIESGKRAGKNIVVSDDEDDWVLIKSPEYLKLVYSLMQRECNTELKALDQAFHGKLQRLLFPDD